MRVPEPEANRDRRATALEGEPLFGWREEGGEVLAAGGLSRRPRTVGADRTGHEMIAEWRGLAWKVRASEGVAQAGDGHRGPNQRQRPVRTLRQEVRVGGSPCQRLPRLVAGRDLIFEMEH